MGNSVSNGLVISGSQRPKLDSGLVPHPNAPKHFVPRAANLYDDLPEENSGRNLLAAVPFFDTLSTKLGLSLPNPAPEVEIAMEEPILPPIQPVLPQVVPVPDLADEPRKKKYAKEAWPGKKHGPQNLLV